MEAEIGSFVRYIIIAIGIYLGYKWNKNRDTKRSKMSKKQRIAFDKKENFQNTVGIIIIVAIVIFLFIFLYL